METYKLPHGKQTAGNLENWKKQTGGNLLYDAGSSNQMLCDN